MIAILNSLKKVNSVNVTLSQHISATEGNICTEMKTRMFLESLTGVIDCYTNLILTTSNETMHKKKLLVMQKTFSQRIS